MRGRQLLSGLVALGFLSSSEASLSQIPAGGVPRRSEVVSCRADITAADEDLSLPDPIILCDAPEGRLLIPIYGEWHSGDYPPPYRNRDVQWGVTTRSGYILFDPYTEIDPPPPPARPQPPHAQPTPPQGSATKDTEDWLRRLRTSTVPPILAPPASPTESPKAEKPKGK